jgi:hypothetical protein
MAAGAPDNPALGHRLDGQDIVQLPGGEEATLQDQVPNRPAGLD